MKMGGSGAEQQRAGPESGGVGNTVSIVFRGDGAVAGSSSGARDSASGGGGGTPPLPAAS